MSKNKITIITMILTVILLLAGGGYYLISKEIIKINFGPAENTYVEVGQFTVKLTSEGKETNNDKKETNRYFKGKIYVGYPKNDRKAKKALVMEKELPTVADAINSYFRGKTYEFLNDPKNSEKMKEEIIEKVNENLETCRITEVKFYDFVLQ